MFEDIYLKNLWTQYLAWLTVLQSISQDSTYEDYNTITL
jgi:hypothetical protein